MLGTRQISICLLLVAIIYCNASPAKETKEDGKGSSKAVKGKSSSSKKGDVGNVTDDDKLQAKGSSTKAKGDKKATKTDKEKSSSTKKGNAGNLTDDDKLLLVNTTCGYVKGCWQYTFITNTKYRSFKAIPYAEPPLGKLRFKKPQKKVPWNETIVTTEKYGASCLERTINEKSTKNRNEDCLFLNIFTPANIPQGKKLPVMFFIPGGRFAEGDGDDKYYGPDLIMEKGRDVILVTINYRLAMFGFMCLDDDEISGNAGLMDQQVALQWIDENIEAFGGDKDCKTVFGQSTGGRSAHFHILSKVSRPLIKRIIVSSGVILPETLYSYQRINAALVKAFAANFSVELKEFNKGKPYDFSDGLVLLKKYLETVPSKLLQEKFKDLYAWIPVIEKKSANRTFMTEQPRQIYATQQIDMEAMFGHTSAEFVEDTDRSYFEKFSNNLNSEGVIGPVLSIYGLDASAGSGSQEKILNVKERFVKCYFKDMKINATSDKDFGTFQKMQSDIYSYHLQEAAIIQSAKSQFKSFYYIFDVNLKLNYVVHKLAPGLEVATHSEEIPYLFHSKAHQNIYETIRKSKDPRDVQTMAMCQTFSDFIIEFAKTGFNDNKKGYEPVTNGEVKPIYISNSGIKPDYAPHKKAYSVLRQAREELKQWIDDPLLSLITSK